tara:strand:+ start:845 stop:1363 length:519 start_codon:yes stop_codon:yes gene_type:complete
MKKVFFLSHLLLLSISFYGSENYFSCDPKKFLSEDMLEKVKLHRESAFNICLSCNGQSCNFKNELISDNKSLSICKRLFCVPSFASRGFEIPAATPRGESAFKFQYVISTEGRIKDVDITSVEGVFSSRDAKEFIKALTRKTKFIPITYENKTYELRGLQSEMNVNTRLGYE